MRTPQSVSMTRELLLALHDAQQEAAAAIGLRGEDARRAMRRERERADDARWREALKHARKSEVRRATPDDYRSTVPADAIHDAARTHESGRAALDVVERGETRTDAQSERGEPHSTQEDGACEDARASSESDAHR